MNGIHDMGGMHGFGRVDREENEPVFHAPWEGRVLGISRACSAQHLFNIDESRHGIERMAPVDYLAASYYERWLDRTVRLLVEKGVITREELDRRMAQLAGGIDPAPPHRDPKLLDRMLRATKERTHFRQPGPPPRFAAGDRVFTRTDAPEGHTRLPRYARGKYGVIDAVHGTFIFPDTNAHGQGEQSHALYSVRFDANDLWGASAEPCSPVHLDLWERYLEPAGAAPGRSTS
jgi:nitrile hydratase subunit beta